MAGGYSIEELADAIGVDAEDLAEDLGYASLEHAESEEGYDYGDFSGLDLEDLHDGWDYELADLWDIDVSDVYDMFYGYEPGGD